MKTSQEWWNEVKNDQIRLVSWLKDQYHGEQTAAVRIDFLAHRFADTPFAEMLKKIALQEKTHALWIGMLLGHRGMLGTLLQKKERYWDKALPSLEKDSLAEIAAVGSHAERMRLERIRVIAHDKTAPWDVRDVFLKILPEEEFHAIAFTSMTNAECLKTAEAKHKEGLNALGLIA